jgi:holo-[acyl-carrier protein] synthase
MIIGVGIDVCSIDRMRRALERHGERFLNRICSPAEQDDMAGKEPATALAGRFAVKEALSKVLDGARGVPWHDVEIRSLPSGRPRLELHRKARELAESYGANTWHVSLTHDGGIAAAVVILEGERQR